MHHAILIILSCLCWGCSAAAHGDHPGSRGVISPLFRETFDHPESVRQDWIATIPETLGATVSFEGKAACLVLPVDGEIELRHPFDAAVVRGKRLKISARLRTDTSNANASIVFNAGHSFALAQATVISPSMPPMEWRPARAVFDVPPDSLRSELSLVLHGRGRACFDDITIETISSEAPNSRSVLTAQQMENVVALTRASTAIRFRHPSDQVAALDWKYPPDGHHLP
jgi:hypothetical protein